MLQTSYPSISLHITDLTCLGGQRRLFSPVEGQLQNQQCLHIQGNNGIGKTTLLATLAGLKQIELGQITFNGIAIQKDLHSYQMHLAYLGHQLPLQRQLNALDNVHFLLALKGIKIQCDVLYAMVHKWNLIDVCDLPCHQLSRGQQQKVALLSVILANRPIWILDEPFTALDVQSSEMLVSLFTQHQNNGGCIIYSSHQSRDLPNEIGMPLYAYDDSQ